jgi:hypothetical protein
MNNNITKKNFRDLLSAFIKNSDISIRKVAKAMDCPKAVLVRVLAGNTWPSDEFLKQGALMMEIGYPRYRKLSKADKEKLSETIGAVSGGGLGVASITAAVSTLGTVAGLSAPGIASGLAALGALVGGGMAAGITVAAIFPVAGGAIGYGLIKGIKAALKKYKLDQDEINPLWEMPIEITG